MAEILSHPGNQLPEEEVRLEIGDIHIMVLNDLKAAAEVKLEEGSEWQIVYPKAQLKMAAAVDSMNVRPELSVRLRDDHNVCGMRTVVPGAKVKLSNGFGDFADWAEEHVEKEANEAKEESRLRKQRQDELDRKLAAEVTQAVLRKQKWAIIFLFLCTLIVLAAMISCTVTAFSLLSELQGVGLAVGLAVLLVCAGFGVAGLAAAQGRRDFGEGLRDSVQAARPELQGYQEEGVKAEDGCDWRNLTLLSCFCCFLLVSLGCVVAMTVAFDQNGSGHLSAVLWVPLAVLICGGGVYGWRTVDGNWIERAGMALLAALTFPFFWPIALLDKCGFGKVIVELVLKPPKRSLDAAVHTTHEHTIVFEGNVLPKRDTVCSWPGKYATAWDELVAGSRQDDISAAVVFLPKGSEHFGFHDPIPAKHDLQDLHGECWCTPLYGEQKPWGCRWWSKWIANIEKAVSQECTLVVYYFNGMKGQGKVKDFTTAGEEHMRREVSGARMPSWSLRVSKMPSRLAWSISRRNKVRTPPRPTQARCIVCSWLGFLSQTASSWRHQKALGIRRRRKLHGWNETVTSTLKKRFGNLKAHRPRR